jgi:hypothetical protein
MATYRQESFKYVGAAALKGYEAMKYSALGAVDLATALTDKIIGFASESAVQNDNIGVLLPGQVVKAQAGAAITAGAYLMVTTAGQVVTATAKSGTGNTTVSWYVGIALEAAAAANDIISILFFPTEVNV